MQTTATETPQANWSRIGAGIFGAKLGGHNLLIAGSDRHAWAVQVDRKALTAQGTKVEAMLWAEKVTRGMIASETGSQA